MGTANIQMVGLVSKAFTYHSAVHRGSCVKDATHTEPLAKQPGSLGTRQAFHAENAHNCIVNLKTKKTRSSCSTSSESLQTFFMVIL